MPAAKKLGWKAVSFGAGALATVATRRTLATVWTTARHSPPPDDPTDRNTSWITALTWAVATGVGIAVVRLVAVRGAAVAWEATVHEPPST